MTVAYSQRDVEWAEDGLGSSKEYTMGAAGCLVTSAASMISDLTGNPIAPGHLNQWLRENKKYYSECLFVFESVVPFGVTLSEKIYCAKMAAPLAHLTEVLADGAVVIIQVDSRPGGETDQHWVRLLSVDDQDGQIMDPWQLPGAEFVKLSRYFAAGWTPARAIFIVAVYRKAAPVRDLFSTGLGGEPTDPDFGGHQETLCICTEPIAVQRTHTTQRAKLAKSGR